MLHWIARRALRVIDRRDPDFIVGEASRPYLRRWWIIPRNRWFNIYLHEFLRDDDDRALHDHPWHSLSIMLKGEYTEHRIVDGGVHTRRIFRAGDIIWRRPRYAHRLELHWGTCYTLFITGPRVREWGFHCPNGWRHWKAFTDPNSNGAITGRGCE